MINKASECWFANKSVVPLEKKKRIVWTTHGWTSVYLCVVVTFGTDLYDIVRCVLKVHRIVCKIINVAPWHRRPRQLDYLTNVKRKLTSSFNQPMIFRFNLFFFFCSLCQIRIILMVISWTDRKCSKCHRFCSINTHWIEKSPEEVSRNSI